MSGIEKVNRNNYASWKENVKVLIEDRNIIHALIYDAPNAPLVGEENYADKKKDYDNVAAKWKRSNCLSLILSRTQLMM